MKKLVLIFSLMVGWMTASAQTYCTTNLYSTGCTVGDDIDDVTIGSFTQTGTGCSTGSYADYTSTVIPFTISQQYYPLMFTTSYSGGEYFGVWVDWNDDGDFDDTTEFVAHSIGSHGSSSPYVDSLLIDPTKPVGVHRMRVRVAWNNALTAGASCTNFGYGEAHDYMIEVKPNIVGGCANAFTNFMVDSILDVSAKVVWTPGTGNSSFFLEYGVAGFTPGTPSGTKITGTYPGAQPPVYLTGLAASTQYDIYFGEICNSGADTVYLGSPWFFQTTVSCPAPYALVDSGTTATTATVAWDSYTGTNFKLEWGPQGFTQGSNGIGFGSANDTFKTITGLQPLTAYDVYVADSCGPGDYSTYTGPVTVVTGCPGAISGTYTLDPSQPYSATNFVSFSQLALALEVCGITGPVTVNVAPGITVNDQITFTEVSGASASNTVTINGNGSTLQFLSTDTDQRATLTLWGADYFIIDSLNVVALGSGSSEYGVTIRITNDADYNIIRNCTLIGDTTSSSSDFANLAIHGSQFGYASNTNGPSGDFNIIEGNTIIGGYYGIVASGQSADSANGNIIRDNIIQDYRAHGIYAYYNDGITIEGNDISRPYRTNLSNSYGIYSFGVSGGTIVENVIHDQYGAAPTSTWSTYPIYMSGYIGSASKRNLVANNLIYNLECNGTIYGMYASGIAFTDIIHNSVIINYPTATGTGITRGFCSFGSIDESNIENNLFYIDRTTTGDKYLMYASSGASGNSSIDHNAYYAVTGTGNFNFGYYNGTAIGTYANWVATTGKDSSSFEVNPYLTDVTNDDYTPQSAVIDGMGANHSSLVNTDINGVTRGALSDPGAIEFTGAPCTGPSGLTSGAVTSNSATINWTTNTSAFDVVWGPVGFMQASLSGDTVSVTSGNTSATLAGLTSNTCYDYYIIQNCTSAIPGAPPVIGPVSVCTGCATPGLLGTYTVGGAAGPSNFATLDSAVSVLNSCGILGPVVFNLQGGTHNAIEITNVSGASVTNTITFNGSANMGDSIATLALPSAVELNGARYVTFNDIYIENNSGNYVVWMHNGAKSINIMNCDLVGNRTTTSSSTAVLAAAGTATSIFSYGDNVSELTVSGCNIIGNYYGMVINGSSSSSKSSHLNILDNQFEDQYTYGIRSYYMDTVVVSGNHAVVDRSGSGYGLYLYYNDFVEVEGNEFYAGSYGIYSYYGNQNVTSSASTSTFSNNMALGDNTYGMYFYSNKYTDIYHNTSVTNSTYGLYIGGSSTQGIYSSDYINLKNNIMVNKGSNYAFYCNNEPFGAFGVDNNLYFTNGADLASVGGTVYSTLAAWQTADAAKNANSVAGDPQFVGAMDFHVIGSLANDAGDNTLGILVDIDGDSRPATGSTTVDIGADEYTPVAHDIALINGAFSKKSACLRNNDTIVLDIQNIVGVAKDFSTTSLTANWDVTGPVNSNGTITVNTGTLAPLDTLRLVGTPVDLSVPGVYTLNAYISPTSENLIDLNDTLISSVSFTVYDDWDVQPDSVIVISNTTDTVVVEARSPFLSGGSFFITEQCHFRYSVGAPAGGWPAYLTADDYIEITGVPGSDLGGIVLEQWGASGLANTFVFPQGTLIGPNGTAVVAVGSPGASTPSPSDFYYHGDVTMFWGSTTPAGRILRDGTGNIIDAVVYSSYVWPVASGVTAADWSGLAPGTGSTSGSRLEGPDDNTATNWVSSATSSQDPNVLNANVPLPAASSTAGFDWKLNGVTVDTMPKTVFGPYTSGGVYNYVATFNGPCGLYSDTVTVIVNLPGSCPVPTNLAGTASACDSIVINWNTAADSAIVAYTVSGGTAGAGSLVIGDSAFAATGLTPNTDYDFYVANICGSDTTIWAGPITINSGSAGAPVASFTANAQSFGDLTYDFDASATTGNGNTYIWNFGDGNVDTGMVVNNVYAAGGAYTVTLVVSNACGSDTITINLADVSLGENVLSQNLKLYPNPVKDVLNVELSLEGNGDVLVRVLDMAGKEIMTSARNKSGKTLKSSVDISGLAKGVYMIEVSDSRYTAVRRLVKE